MNKNKQNKEKSSIDSNEKFACFLAKFLRYYFHFLVIIILFLIGNKHIFVLSFSLSYIFYGIYYIYMTQKLPRHFIFLMLDYDRNRMKNAKPSYPPAQIKEWKHDARGIGLLCIISGICLLLLSIINV